MPAYRLTTPMPNEHALIVRCSCHSAEHAAELTYFDDDDWELCFSFHLCQYDGVLKRVWAAVKYVLGHRCKYGNWDTILVGVATAKEIVGFLQGYVDEREKNK